MYEVTVSAPNEQKCIFNYVCRDVSRYAQQIDAVFATTEQKYRSYFSLATSNTFSFQVQRLLEDSVARAISLGYKNLFVRQLMDISESNFYQDILVDTLCAFDHRYDASLIAKIIDAQKDIYIDGYCNFRIQTFKRKWQNVVNMLLENNYVLADDDLIVEFLQYLLQSSDSKIKQLSVCFDENSYTLFDDIGNVIEKCPTLSPTATAETESIVNAICISPKNLKVYHNARPSQAFLNMANALFDVQFISVQ